MLETQARHDIFEPGDLTALVCIEQPDVLQLVVDQLSSLDYKLHVGLFAEDISMKIKTHPYDVIIIAENLQGMTLSTNSVLYEAVYIPSAQRRTQFLVLVGPNMMTNDEMMSFIFSVDLVFNESDLSNLKPVLRRGVARHKEFYQVFLDVSKTAGIV